VIVVSESPILRAGLQAVFTLERSFAVVGTLYSAADLRRRAAAASAEAAVIAFSNGVDRRALSTLLDGPRPCATVLVLAPPAFTRAYTTALRDRGVHCLPLDVDSAQIIHTLHEGPARPRLVSEPGLRGVGGLLTPRQQQILERLGEGQSNYAIAAGLRITEETVKTHLTAIYRKLGVTSRTEAIAAYLGAL
jgi:DNA-binding NarL/FixJ family response regulator